MLSVERLFGPFGGRFDPAHSEVLAGLKAALASWRARRSPYAPDFLGDMQGVGFSVAVRLRFGLVQLTDALNIVQWLESPARRAGDVEALLGQAISLFEPPRQRRLLRRGGWRVSRSLLHLAPEEALRSPRPLTLPRPAKTPMPAELWKKPCPLCRRPTLQGTDCLHGSRGEPVKSPRERRRQHTAA